MVKETRSNRSGLGKHCVYSELIVHVLKHNFKIIVVDAADTERKNLKKQIPQTQNDCLI